MWSLIVSVTRYDISTYFDAWFCLRWPGLLSLGSLLAEDLNKWHFSSTTSTKENILYIYSLKLSVKLPISKYTYFELFIGCSHSSELWLELRVLKVRLLLLLLLLLLLEFSTLLPRLLLLLLLRLLLLLSYSHWLFIHGQPLFKVPDFKTAETEYDTINGISTCMFININKTNYLGYLSS